MQASPRPQHFIKTKRKSVTQSQHRPTRGRPQAATPEIFQEAALELFQLHGYEHTSVEEIARVAGYSRATFFNHFATKADVFWREIDLMLTNIESLHQKENITTFDQLISIIDTALSQKQTPWIFGNFWLLNSGNEILTGGVLRFLRLQTVINDIAKHTHPERDQAGQRQLAYTFSANLIAGLQTWQEDGVRRTNFSSYL